MQVARTERPGFGAALAAGGVVPFAVLLILHRLAPIPGISVISPGGVVLSLLVGIGLVGGIARHAGATIPNLGLAVAALLAIGGAGTTAAHVLPAASWDGQTYHLPAVIWLMEGWQPLRSPPPVEGRAVLAAFFPSGIWTIQAGLGTLADNFEAGRSVNLLFGTAAAGAVGAWLTGPSLQRFDARAPVLVGASVLLILNPVAVVQAPTAMLDGAVYYLILLLTLALWRWLDRRDALAAATALGAIVLLCNAKLAGLFFAVVIIVVVLAFHAVASHGRDVRAWLLGHGRVIGLLLAAGAVATLGVGFRPYVTNLLDHGRLVYPPVTALVASQVPEGVASQGHLGALVHLVFSANADVGPGGPARLRAPWEMAREAFFLDIDNRSGGFGPAFDLSVCLGALVLLGRFAASRRNPREAATGARIWDVLAVVALSCVVLFPRPWWARFVPMAWVVPLALAGAAWTFKSGAGLRSLAAGILIAASVDTGVALDSALARLRDGIPVRPALRAAQACAEPVAISRGKIWSPSRNIGHVSHVVWQRRLAQAGIAATSVSRPQCPQGPHLTVDVHVCGPCGGRAQ